MLVGVGWAALAGCAGGGGAAKPVRIDPIAWDWKMALEQFSPQRQRAFHAGLPAEVDLTGPADGTVYNLNLAPHTDQPWEAWTVDVPDVVASFDRKFTRPDAIRYRVVKETVFGRWRTESGIFLYEFQLRWTFARPGSPPLTLEGDGLSNGEDPYSENTKKGVAEINQAFADAYLELMFKLGQAARGLPIDSE